MKKKSFKEFRRILALSLTILILFSMFFSLFIETLSYAQVFEQYELIYAPNPEYGPLDSWVKSISYLFVGVWHWIITLICIFIVFRFIHYPDIIITDEIKSMFKIRRKKYGKKKGRQTKLSEFV